MNREKMYNKYAATLAKMAEKEAGDTSVLFDKLVYMAKNRGKEGADSYYVPEGFDYDAFLADYESME